MLRSVFFLLLFSLSAGISGQTLKKFPLGVSGCQYYGFCAIEFEYSKSVDSSAIWSGECVKDSVGYGVICVKLLNPITEMNMAEDMMIAYADYLKSTFAIKKSAGYGKGHRLQQKENTRGIIDYWEDGEKNNWKVKAWTDGRFIGFLYVYSKKAVPETRANLFLDGFRLPE